MLAPVPRTVSDRYAPQWRDRARELHEQFWSQERCASLPRSANGPAGRNSRLKAAACLDKCRIGDSAICGCFGSGARLESSDLASVWFSPPGQDPGGTLSGCFAAFQSDAMEGWMARGGCSPPALFAKIKNSTKTSTPARMTHVRVIRTLKTAEQRCRRLAPEAPVGQTGPYLLAVAEHEIPPTPPAPKERAVGTGWVRGELGTDLD